MNTLITMTKLIATMFLGFALYKMKVIDKDASQTLSKLVISVTNPMLVLSAANSGRSSDSSTVTTFLVAGVAIYALLPVFAYLLTALLKTDKSLRAVYMGTVIFPNFGFMGYPVVQALFGNEAVFFTSILHICSGILFFTFQTYMMKKSAEADGLISTTKNETLGKKLKEIFNNGLIAAIGALIIYFFNVSLPTVITETLSFIGNISMPLAMLAIGCNIGEYKFKDIFKDKNTYIFSFVRLIICPIAIYFCSSLFIKDDMILRIITITSGTPVAVLLAMAAAKYENQRKQASVAVAFSTLFSAITIPLMVLILGV